jgi:hypothetical protein
MISANQNSVFRPSISHKLSRSDLIAIIVGPVPGNEKTFRLAKYFCSVRMEKRYPAYRVKFPAVT